MKITIKIKKSVVSLIICSFALIAAETPILGVSVSAAFEAKNPQ